MNDTEIFKDEKDTIQGKNENEKNLIDEDAKKVIRTFKKDINRITGVILWNSGIDLALGVNIVFWVIVYCILCFPDITSMLDQCLEITIGLIWIICILSATVNVIFASIYGRKKLGLHKIILTHKKMNLSSFAKIFVCAIGISTLFSIIHLLIEVILNHFNLTLTNDSGVLTESMNTIPGFIYFILCTYYRRNHLPWSITEGIKEVWQSVCNSAFINYLWMHSWELSARVFCCVHRADLWICRTGIFNEMDNLPAYI